MTELAPCPECSSTYTYKDFDRLCCPECGHEWSDREQLKEPDFRVVDVNGNILQEGDHVTVIKDLKVKGSSSSVKIGTKVRINRLVDSDHNIDCKVTGIGAMKLKSEFVKKLN